MRNLYAVLPVALLFGTATLPLLHVSGPAAPHVAPADPAALAVQAGADLPSNDAILQALSSRAFEENRGQFAHDILMVAPFEGGTAFLTREGVRFSYAVPAQAGAGAAPSQSWAGAPSPPPAVDHYPLWMTFVNAGTPTLVGEGGGLSPLRYLLSNEPAIDHIHRYAAVLYQGVWPGIDMRVHYDSAGQLEYDFVVAPTADASVIQYRIQGAENLALDADGALAIDFAGIHVVHHAPSAVVRESGAGVPVAFVLRDGVVSFHVAAPVHGTLVIDPPILYRRYASYIGSGDLDAVTDVQLHVEGTGSGKLYLYAVGWTGMPRGPPPPPPPAPAFVGTPITPMAGGCTDGFVAKFLLGNHPMTAVYVALIGLAAAPAGAPCETVLNGVYLTAANLPYVSGYSTGAQYPVCASCGAGGIWDGIMAELNAAGTGYTCKVQWGGANPDYATRLAVDSSGGIDVTGATWSTLTGPAPGGPGDYPITVGAFDQVDGVTAPASGGDAFITQFNPTCTAINWSTFDGGDLEDAGWDIAVDGSNRVYTAGFTDSASWPPFAVALTPGFPVAPNPGPLSTFNGIHDGFVTATQPGGALIYSVYLGTGGTDWASAVAVDPAGTAYIAGSTDDSAAPFLLTPAGALQPVWGTGVDAFLTTLNPAGGMTYESFYGGPANDFGTGITLDTSSGPTRVVLSGESDDTTPLPGSLPGGAVRMWPDQDHGHGAMDDFVTMFKPAYAGFDWSTYHGGTGSEMTPPALPPPGPFVNPPAPWAPFPPVSTAVWLGKQYVAIGSGTDSTNMPIRYPYQAANAAALDGFVAVWGPAECADGYDNDGNGITDNPAPPPPPPPPLPPLPSSPTGCDNAQDNHEGSGTECTDTTDNDGDGTIDAADPDCPLHADEEFGG